MDNDTKYDSDISVIDTVVIMIYYCIGINTILKRKETGRLGSFLLVDCFRNLKLELISMFRRETDFQSDNVKFFLI
jgi:hypothetical protein